MAFVVGLLTVFLVLDCFILVLLVLIQLPKKEAGGGIVFGGAATDALFGAGSGNVLTKATKYTAGAFFALALVLSIMQVHLTNRGTSEFERALHKEQSQPAPSAPGPAQPAPSKPAAAPATAPATNFLITVPTNNAGPAPAATPTNSPAAAPK